MSYATRRTRSWRNPNWPRSGESGSVAQREDLLAHERAEDRAKVALFQSRDGLKARHGERSPEDRCVLEHAPLIGRQVVETRGDERLEARRHVERLDRRRRVVGAALASQQAAVDEHPHSLDRVERDALGPLEDLGAELGRQAGNGALEQPLELRRGERLEVERGEAALRRAPRRPPLDELGPGGREDEDRPVARPVEQVLDEVEQGVIGPVKILEEQDRRRRVGEALEEDAPRAEQVLLVARAPRLDAEQLGQARLDEPALVGVGDVLLERCPQLRQGRRVLLVLEDARRARGPSRPGPRT